LRWRLAPAMAIGMMGWFMAGSWLFDGALTYCGGAMCNLEK
jgi:hypothetical protein